MRNYSENQGYRGMGLGEKLSCLTIEKCKKQRANKVSLLVFENNLPAINLYKKLGFEQSINDDLENQLKREITEYGQRRIYMSKILD